MKLFRETIAFFTNGEFFAGVIECMFALAVSVAVFAAVIISYIYKPEILLYLLIAGMLIMGWFMLYFIFPELHERVNELQRYFNRQIKKLRSK